jgi:hypothetical protein
MCAQKAVDSYVHLVLSPGAHVRDLNSWLNKPSIGSKVTKICIVFLEIVHQTYPEKNTV